MMQIWGRANSSNVMKLLWLCDELGVPFERIDAGGAFGRTHEPGYLAMNPNARVPTLVEPDGFTLWESNAICRYICATRAPDGPLYPADPRARAEIERWMDWQLAHITPPMTTVFFTHVRIPEPERDWDATAKALAEAGALWAMLEARLAGRDFVCGGLTLADIALGPHLHRWFALPLERPDLPLVRGWYDRLLARPGFAQVIAAVPLT